MKAPTASSKVNDMRKSTPRTKKDSDDEQTTVQLGLTDGNGRTETALYADQEEER